MRAVLLKTDPDLATVLRVLCDLADIDLTIEESEASVLLAAHQARPGDFLILDCSHDHLRGIQRALGIVSATAVPAHVIHPSEEFARLLQEHALGTLTWLPPDFPALGALERLRLLRLRVAPERTLPNAPHLSARELEIFQLLGEGKSDMQIARETHLSPSTVKTHVRNIKQKLDVSTRDELIEICRRTMVG